MKFLNFKALHTKVVISAFALLLTTQGLSSTTKTVQQLQKEFIEKVIVESKYKSRFKNYLSNLCGDIYLNDKCVEQKIAFIKTWDTVIEDQVLHKSLKKRIERLALDKNKFDNNILELDPQYWEKTKKKLKDKLLYANLDKSQFVSIIDLSRQKIIIALYDFEYDDFFPVGVDLISSGNMDREASVQYGEDHYFDSPKGIFRTRGGWRSDGEVNENGTLGYGAKDRYIFYLGRQSSVRYNTFDKERNKIQDKSKWKLIKDELEFAMHAHESDMPLGGAYSHGCIRTSNELNKFLDSNLVLHRNNLDQNSLSWKQRYVPSPKEPKNHTLAGEYVIIVDKI